MTGRWTSTEDVKPTAMIGGVTVLTEDEPDPGFSLQFRVPDLGGPARPVEVSLYVGAQASQGVQVQFTG